MAEFLPLRTRDGFLQRYLTSQWLRILYTYTIALYIATEIRTCSSYSLSTRLHPWTVYSEPKKSWSKRLHMTSTNEDFPSSVEGDESMALRDNFPTRRGMLVATTATAAALSIPELAQGEETPEALEGLVLGDAKWIKTKAAGPDDLRSITPSYFTTYATRFLIRYDEGAQEWWEQINQKYSLLPDNQRQQKLGLAFGSFARSVQISFDNYVRQATSAQTIRQSYASLLQYMLDRYGQTDEAKRHVGLMFSMLPTESQPVDVLKKILITTSESPKSTQKPEWKSENISEDLASLLPIGFNAAISKDSGIYEITPELSLFEVGLNDQFGQGALGTPFGPLSLKPLSRDLLRYPLETYALFGISGATGCALTHTVVIPLDVVKTRAQTDPEQFQNLLVGAKSIVEKEGTQALLLGSQATIAGYFWYGLSVYPSYTFFKRFIAQGLLQPEIAAAHSNDIALIAGAIAAVIASYGLTPIEAARIRVVAEPDKYRPLGLIGTLQEIAREDIELGWKTLYAGLPSLMSRQVVFGSIKFLAFERSCEAIYAAFPGLKGATWTALGVSLVAGGIAGSISAIVSQPADSILTYAAQNSVGASRMGVIEGARSLIEEEGPVSLFRGLGSRCLWAGSIIAGQFLLYDVFRTFFSVGGSDLSEVYQLIIPNQL